MTFQSTAEQLRTEDTLFRSPEQIVQTMLEINERIPFGSDFNELTIRQLGEPPLCPVSDDKHLYCLMLLPTIGDPASAFGRFWEAFKQEHKGAVTWPQLELNRDHLKLKDEATLRPNHPAWAVVELGRATQGKCVIDANRKIREAGDLPIGPELALVGAVHPAWADAMDGSTVPYVYAGDVDVTFGSVGFHGFVPYLSRRYACAKDFVLHVESSDSMCSLFGTGSVRYQTQHGK